MNYFIRIILIIIGTLSLILGILGILLPLLPTTPFLLLAAICYARSSEQFYNWLLDNRLLGRFIRDYREGKGIPFKGKILSILTVWISIGWSTYLIQNLFWNILLILIAISVTIYILSIKAYNQ
ncbi:hypothetical protein SAMN04488698_10436 [Candidatus Frackibacter sp. WG12]|nr:MULTISPECIES: YbaN family protein [unclassified Candidatus Frackibacter]KXS41742.1 MAG: hypothetical protein AWU54_1542 [Candidatus Frackibacter sp. T328-2]SDC17699.1 hypothetical protein SAMN04515661_103104 [Candidatus Frackibacter sp. WG11]SEM44279.1 hypothetical protein SAMN04488698_10436 [Candidatus Frackibacter sp. WG12]SFL46812.1 hypothetical protein SAMN04488699_10336 [Candidatus Frackibacter sp. WG13]